MRDEFDFEGNRRRKKIILYIVSTILEAALLVFLGFAVTHFGMQSMAISVEDMSPTLNVGDQILINKMSYHIHKPRREDVIVVKEKCEDSRNASVGNIRKGDILGKAWIRKKPSFTFVKMIDPNFTIEEN